MEVRWKRNEALPPSETPINKVVSDDLVEVEVKKQNFNEHCAQPLPKAIASVVSNNKTHKCC